MLVIGIFIGANLGICIMCLFQINRENKLQQRINKAIDVIHTQMKYHPENKSNLKIIELNLIKGSCTPKDLRK